MEFCVPTNWQESTIEHLISVNTTEEIKEVYGKIFADTMGYEAASCGLESISRKKAQRHIKDLSSHGFSFNYLLDDICMDNLEFTRKGQMKIRNILEWLIKAEVNSVTIANPYLMLWIKENYSFLPVYVSASVNVDSLNRAKFWEGLGADMITFPGPVINRNFKFIELLRKSLACKIQLLGNNACRQDCASYINHALNTAHSFRRTDKFNGHIFDYYVTMCWVKRLENPINFIRCDWIRPEDVCFYEKKGVDRIQLVDIDVSGDRFIQICGAYINRCHKGNLIELFPGFDDKIFIRNDRKPGAVASLNPFLTLNQPKARDGVFINNQNLSSFLKEMPPECDLSLCRECGYCLSVTEQVVKIDQGYLQKTLALYKKTIDSLF